MDYKLLATALAAATFYVSPVHANTKVTFGATVVDGSDVAGNLALEHSSEKGRWQQVYELEQSYKNSGKPVNELYALAKVNYKLSEKTYMVNVIKADFDHYGYDQLVAATGFGYKLYRSEHLKVSNEITGGAMQVDSHTKPVVRNSLWIRYNDGRWSFVNKLLAEYNKETYLRNQTELGYRVEKSVTVGVRNTWVRSPVHKTNMTMITLGIDL